MDGFAIQVENTEMDVVKAEVGSHKEMETAAEEDALVESHTEMETAAEEDALVESHEEMETAADFDFEVLEHWLILISELPRFCKDLLHTM